MRSTNTFGIQFLIRANKIKNHRAPIYCRITVDSRRVEISMKRWIDAREWNAEKGSARGSREVTKTLNHYLNEVRSRIVECYQEMQINQQLISAEDIKNKFLGIGQTAHSLCELVMYHNTQMKETLTWGTMKNYFTTQKYISRFLKHQFRRDNIFLSELNYKFILDLEYFLRNYKPSDHNRPLANNGVMKHMERFRKMIHVAVKMEWLDKDPFLLYKQKFDKVERGFLSQEELRLIETRKFPIDRLAWVRDLFIFSCYTGLSYIDVMQLKPTSVAIGIDNEFWLNTHRQKTSNPVHIPLLGKAMDIINKYKIHPRALTNGTLFPIISNQKLNSYLKEIADLCGIRKHLTFHLARHTFATTVTLTNGVPIESVSKMLGHSKITTTQIYAKVIERKLSEDMKALNEKLCTLK